jgi:hypothetical protein
LLTILSSIRFIKFLSDLKSKHVVLDLLLVEEVGEFKLGKCLFIFSSVIILSSIYWSFSIVSECKFKEDFLDSSVFKLILE